ncbi:CdaR family protein [Aneurinibacillus aneurinilyticus]|uniref:CdaR family protein n=1 Tax=Aneurinibacillus aneurinilyticus TaxID=1391 RepID=UPI002E2019E0|nr:CdaR family protein [Aneurinibacillus aneurinilyticus]
MDRWLNNNTVVKVISLLLALMLWAVVNNDPTVSTGVGPGQVTSHTNQVGLKVRYDARKYLVQAPSTVQVELKGRKDLLAMSSLISPDSFDVYVDLRNYGSGKHDVPVQYEGVPRGLEVAIQPSHVTVTIEEIKKIEKTIQVDVVGKTKAYGKVGQPVVNPQTVTVTVPESRVKDVAFVRAYVSVEGAEESVDTRAPLRVLDHRGDPVEAAKVSPATVDIHVPLSLTPAKTVPLKVGGKGVPADGYQVTAVTVNPKQVTLYGSQEVLNTISAIVLPDVEVSGLSESKTVPVNIPLPDKIQKADVTLAEVSITIVKKDEAAIGAVPNETGKPEEQPQPPATIRDSVELPIKVQGLAEGQSAEFVKPSSGRIEIQLQGTKEAIEKMDKNKLFASIDMSGKPSGQYTSSIHVSNLPSDVKIVNQQGLQAVVLVREQVDNQRVNS